MDFNWLDLLVIAVFIFYALEGLAGGFVRGLLDLASLLLSFSLSLKFYSVTGQILIQNFSLSHGMANAVGFFLTAFILQMIFGLTFPLLSKKIPHPFLTSPLSKLLGILPGLASSTILLSFLLTLILSLPLSPFLKNAVNESKLGSLLTARTAGFERLINQVFGQAALETINFITIKSGEKEVVKLGFQVKQFSPDLISEQKMLELLNQEREKRGFPLLVSEPRLQNVARAQAREMFEEGYFSHYTEEGLSPFDRLAAYNIDFNLAGENLAFAPNVALAHNGLMNSPGHKANILSPEFHKVGIGVIDGGIYGKMFVQEFTD